MECNKGDAHKAKEIAENKFMEKDIVGAKKFADKAQNLYSELDGISQFIATLDVYISAEHRINGEVDWYRVLNVAPSADDDTIRKHYRKLALVLHPDKNKSVGADGAFKILSEAWCLLSDKARRSAYDQKRNLGNLGAFIRKFASNVSVPASRNGSNNFSKHNHSDAKTHKSSMCSKPSQHPPFSKANTFWTICNACGTQFEYLKVYINNKLLCQNCRKPFLGVEVPPPNINGNSSPTIRTSRLQGQTPAQKSRAEYPLSTGKKPVSAKKMGYAAHSGSIPSAVSSDSQVDKLKRRHVETTTTSKTGALSGSELEDNGLKKKRRIDEHRMHITKESASQKSHGNVKGSAFVYQRTSFETGSENTREIRNALIDKAKKSISDMVRKWNSVTAASNNLDKGMEDKENMRQKNDVNCRNSMGLKCGKTRVQLKKPCPANHDNDDDSEINSLSSMNVPDPDFHNFDEDRTEKSFGHNQAWAAYDDDDGMPRFYAIIHDVISLKPFKMRISWLNTKSNRELAPLSWIESGFYKTSGEFWIGKHAIYKSLNSFSHKVKWTKGTRGAVHIYPKKGDVWALYRNWSPDWNELTPDEVIHKYDMVEVLEDYNEDRGVTVSFLVKVAGFKAVFRRQSDPNKSLTITRQEMFRLSHQVPFHLLTGEEGDNVPKGCVELDPASTPLELLQVLTEAQVEELMKATEEAKEDEQHKDAEIQKEQELGENGKTNKGKIELDNVPKNDATVVRKNEEQHSKETSLLVYKRRS